jgi:succinate-acetate transporter protein
VCRLAVLRLPSTFALVNVLMDIALALILAGTIRGSANLDKAAGWVIFVSAAVGGYPFRRGRQHGYRREGPAFGAPIVS